MSGKRPDKKGNTFKSEWTKWQKQKALEEGSPMLSPKWSLLYPPSENITSKEQKYPHHNGWPKHQERAYQSEVGKSHMLFPVRKSKEIHNVLSVQETGLIGASGAHLANVIGYRWISNEFCFKQPPCSGSGVCSCGRNCEANLWQLPSLCLLFLFLWLSPSPCALPSPHEAERSFEKQ